MNGKDERIITKTKLLGCKDWKAALLISGESLPFFSPFLKYNDETLQQSFLDRLYLQTAAHWETNEKI